jgi:rhodanese-related sulfurtransferase
MKMKKTVIALFVLLVIGLAPAVAQRVDPVDAAVAEYFSDWPSNSRIVQEADVVARLAAGEAMTLIDIRRADDYAQGHLKGAINLPWGTAALSGNLRYLPQSGPVYVYCYTGQTAGQAVALLNVAGIPAESVRFGWNLGISKVENVAAVTTTEVTALDTSRTYPVDRTIEATYRAYYSDMAGKAGTSVANNIIPESEAKRILDSNDRNYAFVSIRRATDFANGHIEGAINIPWGQGMDQFFPNLDARKTLIVYCYTGQTAGQAVAMMRLLGYDAVSLRGGMGTPMNAPQGWSNQGFPVVQ